MTTEGTTMPSDAVISNPARTSFELASRNTGLAIQRTPHGGGPDTDGGHTHVASR